MAYFKGTPRNPTSSVTYDVKDMMYSIGDFLEGTDWRSEAEATGSKGFNGENGTYAGTTPTAGIYYGIAPGGGSTDGDLTFYKKHYAHAEFASAPALKIVLRADAPDGWRIHVYDKNGSNISPNTNVSSGIGGTTNASFNAVPQTNGDHGSSLEAVHIIANDTTFAIKIVSGGSEASGNTPTTIDHGWVVINDLEYSPTLDLWAHGADNTYCPTTLIHSSWMNVMSNPSSTAAGTNYAHFGVTQPRYIDASGTVRTGSTNPYDAINHFGSYTTKDQQWSTINPAPAFRQDSFSIAGADTPAHMLCPVTFIGQQRMSLAGGSESNDLQKNPRRGRLMNFYRITDDCAGDGDVLLEGSTRYRVMKPHMTGDYNGSSANVKACYAFPEDNVPYA